MSKHINGPWKADTDNWIRDERDQLLLSVRVDWRSREEVHAIRDAVALVPDLIAGLEAIARKVPHKVSREEAADMACEFHAIASKLLERISKREEIEGVAI